MRSNFNATNRQNYNYVCFKLRLLVYLKLRLFFDTVLATHLCSELLCVYSTTITGPPCRNTSSVLSAVTRLVFLGPCMSLMRSTAFIMLRLSTDHCIRIHRPSTAERLAFPMIISCLTLQKAEEVMKLQTFISGLDFSKPATTISCDIASSQEISMTLRVPNATFYPVVCGKHSLGIHRRW